MTKVNFKQMGLIAAMAIGLVSCGSKGNKQQSGDSSEAKTGQSATVNLADYYTAVERPQVEHIEAWMIPADGVLTTAEKSGGSVYQFVIGGMTNAQYEKYIETLKANGMKKAPSPYGASYTNGSVHIHFQDAFFQKNGGEVIDGEYQKSYFTFFIDKE
jgi:hypothetical protein